VHGEIKKSVITLWVMRHFFILRGAPRACVDFCDPTGVSRIMQPTQTLLIFDTLLLAGRVFIIGDSPYGQKTHPGLQYLKNSGFSMGRNL